MFPNYKEESGKLKYINSSEESKEAKQNKVIELYKELILHQSNITKIMTPLDFEHIKNDAQNLAPAKEKSDLDNFEFIQDIVTKYSFLAGLAGVGQEANTSSDYAMGTMSDIYLYDVNLGPRSHQGESFAVEKNIKGEVISNDVAHTKFDNINSMPISDTELREYINSYNKRAPKDKHLTFEKVQSYKTFAVSDNISALMNAFVDIAKDPYITNVNWNMMTTNTGNMMLRAGVHPFIVMSFLAQPIIGEYIDFIGQYETRDKSEQTSNSKDAFRIYKVGELIKDELIHVSNFENGEKAQINARTFYEIATKYGFDLENLEVKDFTSKRKLQEVASIIGLPKDHKFSEDDIKNIHSQLNNVLKKHSTFFTKGFNDYVINDSLGSIRENVFKNNLNFQSRAFQTFLVYQSYAKKLKASVDASKHSVNGIGKNTTQLLVAQNRIKNIENKGVINYDTKMYYEDGSPKFLAYLKQYNLDNIQKIVQNNPLLFVSSTPFVWNSYNEISKNIYGINLEDDSQGGLADKLDKTFNTYLMSGFDPFVLNNEEKRKLLDEFPNIFNKFKSKHPNKYKIVDELGLKQTKERLYILSTNKTNSKEYTDDMINSWKELIRVYPDIGIELVKYAFITSGFNNNTSSFFQFIPPSFFFQNNFNGYVKEFTKYPGDIDENFINHFYLSNLTDSQIVKYVNKTMILKDQPFSKDKIISMNTNVTKDFINIDDTFYKRIGTKTIKGNTYNLYTTHIKVDGGFAKIKSLTSDKDGGITINNFNSKTLSLPVDTTLTKDNIKALNDMINSTDSQSINTTQEDNFSQDDVVTKEPLTNLEVENQPQQLSLFNNSQKLWNENKDLLESNDMNEESFNQMYNEFGEDFIIDYITKCKKG